ncbi:hypothetical protein D3C87_1567860 [compost metagenome]
MQHEGNFQIQQQFGPLVIEGGRMEDHRIDALAGGQAAIGGQLFLLAGDGGDDNVDVLGRHAAAKAGEEFGHVGAKLIGAAQHETDGASAACGEAQGAGIGAIAEQVRSLGNAQARRLLDFRIAIESAAHRRLRQAEMLGKVFQSHSG